MNIKHSNIFIFCVSLIMVFTVLLIFAPCTNADALSDELATNINGVWLYDRIPIKYTIDDTFSGPEKQAIKNAFDTWEAANSRMQFKKIDYNGQTLLADPVGVTDPSTISDVVLVTKKTLKELHPYYISDTTGLGGCPSAQAFPLIWQKSKQIYGGSIILVTNPQKGYVGLCSPFHYSWSTSNSLPNRSIDLESTMLHEIGHLIGLMHPNDMKLPTIMGRVVVDKIHRTLYQADIEAIRRLYPKTANNPPIADLLGTAMVAKNTHLNNKIASHDIEEGKIVYFKGWPIGNKTPLRKSEIVNVLNIYANYSESKYTMKIQTKIGKVGYVLNSDLTELKITAVGERGEITALVLSLPYEYEGDTKLVERDISKYKSFVNKYPNSAYANVALLKIADLHLYTFQDKETNGKKASRVEELQTIYKRLSKSIEDTQGKKVAKELDEFISHNKKRIINTDYQGSESQHLSQMNERLFEFCPKILSEP
jgi:hypothetical protein